jgi:hypothetical protein
MELSLDDPQTGGPPPGGGGEEPKKKEPQKKKCPKCLLYPSQDAPEEGCPGLNECHRIWAFLLRQAGTRKGLKDSSGGC